MFRNWDLFLTGGVCYRLGSSLCQVRDAEKGDGLVHSTSA